MIYAIVQMLGLNHFGRLWNFFKLKPTEAVKAKLREKYEKVFRDRG